MAAPKWLASDKAKPTVKLTVMTIAKSGTTAALIAKLSTTVNL